MFKRTYMSLAVSRALETMELVGDPFGGPAFGEREKSLKSIIKIAAVGLAVVTGGTSMGFSLAAIASTATYVGMGMTVVGAVTGNKNLLKIGGVLTLAGGLTTMAIQAGYVAGGVVGQAGGAFAPAEAATAGSAAVPAAAAPVTTTAPTLGSEAATLAPANTVTNGEVLATRGLTAPANTGFIDPGVASANVAPTVTTAATPAISQAAAGAAQTPITPSFSATAPAATVPATTVDMGVGAGITGPAPISPIASGASGAPIPGAGGWLDKVGNIFTGPSGGFAVMGATNLLGSSIAGYAQGQAAQQKLKYEKELTAQQNYNMNYAGRGLVGG